MFQCLCCAGEVGDDAKLAETITAGTQPGREEGLNEFNPIAVEEQSQAPQEIAQAPEPEPAPKAPEPTLEAVTEEPAPVEPDPAEPGSAAQPAPATSEQLTDCTDWEVTISKSPDRDKVGLNLTCHSPTFATVRDIKDGTLISEWNMSNPEKIVRYGDAIMAVNGATDFTSMIARLKEDSSLAIRVRRVFEFTFHVEKSSGGLGITFSGPGSRPAKVVQIVEGKAVAQYSKGAEAGKAVLPGDLIVSVNGEAGTKDAVVSAITKASGTLELKVKRPST